MINLNRRTILTGAVSSVFMPAIVKADNLMSLKGVIMDPLVLSYGTPDDFDMNRCLIITVADLRKIMEHCNLIYGSEYNIVRLSECDLTYK